MKNSNKILSGTKKFFYFIIFPIIVFSLVVYIGNVLLIGEKIGNVFGNRIGCIVEILFDTFFIFIPLFLVLWQIKKNLFKYKPYKLEEICDDKASENEINNFAKLINNESLNKAVSNLEKREIIKNLLGQAKKDVREKTVNTAILAAVSVFVSPRSFGDFFCMMLWSFRTINQVLQIYGFRPHGMSLVKLYIKVLFSSLLVGSVEEIMDNIFPGEKIPFLSPAVQAFAAAFAIFKTAHLTEYYLIHGLRNHEDARKAACKEAHRSLASLKENDEFKARKKEILEISYRELEEKIKSFFKFNLSIVSSDDSSKTQNLQ